jgi:hypothetical protein
LAIFHLWTYTYVKKKLQLNIPIDAYQKIKYLMDFYNHFM